MQETAPVPVTKGAKKIAVAANSDGDSDEDEDESEEEDDSEEGLYETYLCVGSIDVSRSSHWCFVELCQMASISKYRDNAQYRTLLSVDWIVL